MREEKMKVLLNYLSELRQVNEHYHCNQEISEVLGEIREEMGLTKGLEGTVIDEFEVSEDGYIHIERQDHKLAGTFNDLYKGEHKVIILRK